MSKKKSNIKNLLQEASRKDDKFVEAFEEDTAIAMPQSSSVTLTQAEEDKLKLLLDVHQTKEITSDQALRDFNQLKEVSLNVKALTKQSLILHGECIFKAQSVLKDYRRGAFTEWLRATYNSRSTPYALLHYYRLHKDLSVETKKLFEKMPSRAAYLLGSRKGDIGEKINLIKEYHEKPQDIIIEEIREKFPLNTRDKRAAKDLNQKLASEALSLLMDLKKRKKSSFNKSTKQILKDISKLVASLSN